MFTVLLTLIRTLPNVALAKEGDEGCEDLWPIVESEEPFYLRGVGCVVGDIGEYCERTFSGDCLSWDQAVAIYEESTTEVKESNLLDCAMGSNYAHRLNQSSSEWEAYLYFDEDGFAAGKFHLTYGDPSCCAGFETSYFLYGDPYATCIEPTDTGGTDTGGTDTGGTDTGDTSKTGPCGCAANTGGAAAAALLTALTLSATRRRRHQLPR